MRNCSRNIGKKRNIAYRALAQDIYDKFENCAYMSTIYWFKIYTFLFNTEYADNKIQKIYDFLKVHFLHILA